MNRIIINKNVFERLVVVVDCDLQLALKEIDPRWFTTQSHSSFGGSCGSHNIVPMCSCLSSRIWLQTVST